MRKDMKEMQKWGKAPTVLHIALLSKREAEFLGKSFWSFIPRYLPIKL